MTVYTDLTLTSWYIDDELEIEFTDDLANDVIITDEAFVSPSSATFFGYLRMVLWQ